MCRSEASDPKPDLLFVSVRLDLNSPENTVSKEKTSPSYPPSQNESQIKLTGDADGDTRHSDDLPDDVYIPTSETYGLPRRDKNAFRKQAQAIIAARHLTSARAAPGHKSSQSVNTVDSAATSDEEDAAPSQPMQVPKGAGILGSLSTFEAQQQQRQHNERKQAQRRGASDDYKAKDKKRRDFRSYLSSGLGQVRAKFDNSSPTGASGDAGVFGALAAASMDLAGAAAPENTTIRPDPERKGYHVNRWSLQSSRTCARARSDAL